MLWLQVPWEPQGDQVVRYFSKDARGGRRGVVGVRIGRLIVRAAIWGEYTDESDRYVRAFVVEHRASSAVLADCDTFERAVQVADDVSRFAKRDLSARTTEAMVNQLGDDMNAWLDAIDEQNCPLDFRAWLRAR